MIEFLQKIVEGLIRALQGLLGFLEEFIPLIAKICFYISPFVLASVLSFFIGGRVVAIAVSVVSLTLIFIGLAWSAGRNLTLPSHRLLFYVLIIDVLTVGAIVLTLRWKFNVLKQFSDASEVVGTRPPETGTTVSKPTREEVFIRLLNSSIASGNNGDAYRAIEELAKLKSTAAIPSILRALKYSYPPARYYTSESQNEYWTLSNLCIYALIQIGGTQGCETLYEIQVKQPSLAGTARDAVSKLCENPE